MFIKKHYKSFIAVLLICAIVAIAIHSCSGIKVTRITEDVSVEKETASESSAVYHESEEIFESTTEDSSEVVAEEVNEEDHTVDEIYAMVCSSVEARLNEAGFVCEQGVAKTAVTDTYKALGTYYYNEDFNLFGSDELKSVGFVEVVDDSEAYCDASEEDELILIEPVMDKELSDFVCAYNYNDIGASHFVYKDKYVVYYQESPMRVVYSVHNNEVDNYDLSIGSLYDYDNDIMLYDESLLDEYVEHSAVKLYTKEDYEALEKQLQEMSKNQLRNGYVVTKYDVVYISPEQIKAYLDSNEEDTFFGFGVDKLTKSLGTNSTLQYKDGKLSKIEVSNDNSSEYNWKQFLSKVGVGAGIVIVGAVLAPITSGTSFSCALVTALKSTAEASLIAALVKMAIETTLGVKDGKTLENALRDCSTKGLDSFADTFVIAAAICSAGVNTGLIKPSTCFAAGTMIAVSDSKGNKKHKAIEDIDIGDYVLAYSEEKGETSYQKVTEIFKRSTDEVIEVEVNGEVIRTTAEHPFYNTDIAMWIPASELANGYGLLSSEGAKIVVERINSVNLDAPIDVYNFTVENEHNYFVGNQEILVHNSCDNITRMRNNAVRRAWSAEKKAVKSGTSRYAWTAAQKRELLARGAVSGYDGHHIIPVKELQGTAKEYLIESADDIVFLSVEDHTLVHAHGTATVDNEVLVDCVPWVSDQLKLLKAG